MYLFDVYHCNTEYYEFVVLVDGSLLNCKIENHRGSTLVGSKHDLNANDTTKQ